MKFRLVETLNSGFIGYKGYEIRYNENEDYYIREEGRGVIAKGFSTEEDAEDYIDSVLRNQVTESLIDDVHDAHMYLVKQLGPETDDALDAYFSVYPNANVFFSEDGYNHFIKWAKKYGYKLNENKVFKEDTVQNPDGTWSNKGDEGSHGKFKTKKKADAQRKAMFANGYRESLLRETFYRTLDDIIEGSVNNMPEEDFDEDLEFYGEVTKILHSAENEICVLRDVNYQYNPADYEEELVDTDYLGDIINRGKHYMVGNVEFIYEDATSYQTPYLYFKSESDLEKYVNLVDHLYD